MILNLQEAAGPRMPYLARAMTPKIQWAEDDPVRAEKWAGSVEKFGFTNDPMRRRKFEAAAENQVQSMISDLYGAFKRDMPAGIRFIQELERAAASGEVLDEAATLSYTNAGASQHNIGIQGELFKNSIADEVASLQTIELPSARIWWSNPTSVDAYTGDNGTSYDAGHLMEGVFGSPSMIWDLPATAELEDVPKVGINFQSSLIEVDPRKLRSFVPIEIAQDFEAYFGQILAGVMGRSVRNLLIRIADRVVSQTLIDNVPAAHKEDFDSDGFSGVSGEAFLAEMHWQKVKLSEALDNIGAKVQTLYGVRPNYILGNPTSLKPFTLLGTKEGFGFQWNQAAQQAFQNGNIGGVGNMTIGSFNGMYKVICSPNYPADDKIIVGYRGRGDLEQELLTPAVMGMYRMGYQSPALVNPADLSYSQAYMDRWGVKSTLPYLTGQITLV